MTYQSFPLSPVPSYYTNCTQTQRNGVYYEGDTVVITLSRSGANHYDVRDYHGTVVSSGSVSGTTINLGSSWGLGWYRVYLTGPSTGDSLFGDSYGATNFAVIRADPRFPTIPATTRDAFNEFIPNGQGTAHLGGPMELITRACLGIPCPRIGITNTAAPQTGSPATFDKLSDMVEIMNIHEDWWLNPSHLDPVRPRQQWHAFYDDIIDLLRLQPNYLDVSVKDPTIDGAKVFVAASAGTGPGGKDVISVYYPNSSTLVETYNVTDQEDARAQINGTSSYLYCWSFATNAHPTTIAATAIGRARRDGVILTVQTLYPLGVKYYEGPYNEPSFSAGTGIPTAPQVIAHRMRFFQAHVHEGHANAKAMGPCSVDITNDLWPDYLDALNDQGVVPDAISFHDYNTCIQGDINQGRNNIKTLLGWMKDRGMEGTELWQTEASHNLSSRFGVYHPRSARASIAHVLLWEQYGVPAEKNSWWYDYSHGFWSYPSFLFSQYASDCSPHPPVVFWCVMAQETFGKNFHHAVDFGSKLANDMFIGNVYGTAVDGSVMALMCASAMDGSTVTLTIAGTAEPIVVVDMFGNETSVAQSSGRITIDVAELPTYVRLPAGVNAWVYSVRDWGNTVSPSVSAARVTSNVGGQEASVISDATYMGKYTASSTTEGIFFSTSSLPDSAEIKFGQDVSVERAIVFCGPIWQSMPGLLDFDVDTWDGSSWTTRQTVNRTSEATSFWHGTNFSNAGCQRETYYKDQWIEDVKLSSPVTCKGVRVYVRSATKGGEPDANAANFGGYQLGQGLDPCPIAIQSLAVISPTAMSFGGTHWQEQQTDSPVGQWPLSDAAGSTAVSLVNTSSVNGTYGGTYALNYVGPISDGSTAVKLGSFPTPTAGGNITVPHSSLLNVGDTFSLEMWAKNYYVAFAGVNLELFDKGSGSYKLAVLGGTYPDQTAYLALSKNGTGEIVRSTQSLQVGRWYHCVATKNGSDVHLYLNGVDVTGTVTNQTIANTATSLKMGGSGDIHTALAAAAVYPTALSADRVQAHYLAGVKPTNPVNATAPLIAA